MAVFHFNPEAMFPLRYHPSVFPQAQQQVINDWLLWEISQCAEDEYPLLRELYGWRRMEVIDYCRSQAGVWDARIAASYGYPGAIN
jgi:hypothetical protein